MEVSLVINFLFYIGGLSDCVALTHPNHLFGKIGL